MKTEAITWTLSKDAAGKLQLREADGAVYSNVKPLRLFPLTSPEEWIVIRSAEGRELACIEELTILSGEQRRLLLEALAAREFVPVIRSIEDIRHAPNGHEWRVVTDRGQTVFRVENEENIQSMGSGRFVIIDQSNTRYLIPNAAQLDKKSRRRFERYY